MQCTACARYWLLGCLQALLMASTDLVLVSNIDMLIGSSLVEALQNDTE